MAIRWANFEYGVVDTTWPTHVEEQERLLNCTHWYRLQAHTNIPNYWPYLGAFRLRGRLEDCELHVFRRGQDRIFVARAVSDNVLWLNVTLSSHKEALKATRTFAMSVEVIGSIYIPARAGVVQVQYLFRVGGRLVMRKNLLPSHNQRMILLVGNAVLWNDMP